jgi:hypothetical protein
MKLAEQQQDSPDFAFYCDLESGTELLKRENLILKKELDVGVEISQSAATHTKRKPTLSLKKPVDTIKSKAKYISFPRPTSLRSPLGQYFTIPQYKGVGSEEEISSAIDQSPNDRYPIQRPDNNSNDFEGPSDNFIPLFEALGNRFNYFLGVSDRHSI